MSERKTINEYLKKKVLYFDGAFGTYYGEKYDETHCEIANINNPERVEGIHIEYAKAGANFLRSNTFNVSRFNLGYDDKISEDVIRKGYRIVKDAASGYEECYPCADIGPISHIFNIDDKEIIDEYKRIIDIFIDEGAKIFVFETMSNPYHLAEPIDYLRSKCDDAFIIVQFAVDPDGHTKNSISVSTIVDVMSKCDVDVIGLNCASGPMHMLKNLRKLKKLSGLPISTLPNAGSPRLYDGKQVYGADKEYFGSIILEMVDIGAKLVGGCCGTNPEYIKYIIEQLSVHDAVDKAKEYKKDKSSRVKNIKVPKDIDIFVEVSPPKSGNLTAYYEKCKKLKKIGVNSVTLPDSPLAITRMNSTTLATHIHSNFDLNAMPHICCRDKNIIGLKSDILTGYALGIRNYLCVTGDPVAAGSRDDIKAVYNLNSITLIDMINQINMELASDDVINTFAAVNFGAVNFDSMIKRSLKKVKAGAKGFLSQPIYNESDLNRVAEFKKRVDAKLYLGIMPPVSYKNALFLNYEVPGITIPEEVIEGFKDINDGEAAEEFGCQAASHIAKKALDYVDGLYIIPPFGRISCVMRILNNITT